MISWYLINNGHLLCKIQYEHWLKLCISYVDYVSLNPCRTGPSTLMIHSFAWKCMQPINNLVGSTKPSPMRKVWYQLSNVSLPSNRCLVDWEQWLRTLSRFLSRLRTLGTERRNKLLQEEFALILLSDWEHALGKPIFLYVLWLYLSLCKYVSVSACLRSSALKSNLFPKQNTCLYWK